MKVEAKIGVTVVLCEFTDHEWRENFRMAQQTFMKLCSMTEGYIAPEHVTVRDPIPLVLQVTFVLCKLGS